MKIKLAVSVIAILCFALGYFWPRGHYEIRERSDGLRICYVQWDGSSGCSAPLDGWIPMRP